VKVRPGEPVSTAWNASASIVQWNDNQVPQFSVIYTAPTIGWQIHPSSPAVGISCQLQRNNNGSGVMPAQEQQQRLGGGSSGTAEPTIPLF